MGQHCPQLLKQNPCHMQQGSSKQMPHCMELSSAEPRNHPKTDAYGNAPCLIQFGFVAAESHSAHHEALGLSRKSVPKAAPSRDRPACMQTKSRGYAQQVTLASEDTVICSTLAVEALSFLYGELFDAASSNQKVT